MIANPLVSPAQPLPITPFARLKASNNPVVGKAFGSDVGTGKTGVAVKVGVGGREVAVGVRLGVVVGGIKVTVKVAVGGKAVAVGVRLGVAVGAIAVAVKVEVAGKAVAVGVRLGVGVGGGREVEVAVGFGVAPICPPPKSSTTALPALIIQRPM